MLVCTDVVDGVDINDNYEVNNKTSFKSLNIYDAE